MWCLIFLRDRSSTLEIDLSWRLSVWFNHTCKSPANLDSISTNDRAPAGWRSRGTIIPCYYLSFAFININLTSLTKDSRTMIVLKKIGGKNPTWQRFFICCVDWFWTFKAAVAWKRHHDDLGARDGSREGPHKHSGWRRIFFLHKPAGQTETHHFLNSYCVLLSEFTSLLWINKFTMLMQCHNNGATCNSPFVSNRNQKQTESQS